MFRNNRTDSSDSSSDIFDIIGDGEVVDTGYVPLSEKGAVRAMPIIAVVILVFILASVSAMAFSQPSALTLSIFFAVMGIVVVGAIFMLRSGKGPVVEQSDYEPYDDEGPSFPEADMAPRLEGDFANEEYETDTTKTEPTDIVGVVLEGALFMTFGLIGIFEVFSWIQDWLSGTWLRQFFTATTLLIVALVWIGFMTISGVLVIRKSRTRVPTPLQRQVRMDQEDRIWVTEKELFKLRHMLVVDLAKPKESETIIYAATRMYRPGYLGRVLRLPVGLLIAFGVLWYGSTHQYDVSLWFSGLVIGPLSFWAVVEVMLKKRQPRLRTRLTAPLVPMGIYLVYLFGSSAQYDMPPRVSTLFVAGVVAWCVMAYQSWHDWYLLLTDKNVVPIRMQSLWFWWHPVGSAPRFSYSRINMAYRKDQGGLGNMLGYDTVLLEVLGEEDDPYKRLEFIPHGDDLAKLIIMQVQESAA